MTEQLLFVPVALTFEGHTTYVNLSHIEEIIIDTKGLRLTIYWHSGRQSILTAYQASSFIGQLKTINDRFKPAKQIFYQELINCFEEAYLKFGDEFDRYE